MFMYIYVNTHIFTYFSICLYQRLTNYSPRTKSSWSPIFANEVVLEYSHVHSFTYCLALQLQDQLLQKPNSSPKSKYLLPGPLCKKFAISWSSLKTTRNSLSGNANPAIILTAFIPLHNPLICKLFPKGTSKSFQSDGEGRL